MYGTHLDLFSGIDGFAIAVEAVWPGIRHVFVDYEPFAQAVTRKHWPDAEIHGDIRTFRGDAYGPVKLVTGGFPCQPFSAAGRRKGTEDDRYLWPEMFRIIREAHPDWVVAENVSGLLTWDGGLVLETVLTDLESEGYEAWPVVLPAASVGAPHLRNRIWIIANSIRRDARGTSRELRGEEGAEWIPEWNEMGQLGISDPIRHGTDSDRERFEIAGESTHTKGEGRIQARNGSKNAPHPQGERRRKGTRQAKTGRTRAQIASDGRDSWCEDWPAAATRLCALDDGIPGGLARPRGWRNAALKGAGNAIVPQVAEMIMRAIATTEQ